MSRSLKKGVFINPKLEKKIKALQATGKHLSTTIKTWARDSMISPDMVGMKFDVHTGNAFKTVLVTEDMVGHRLGEFVLTRKFQGHAKKGKISKVYGFSGRFIKE